MTLWIPKAGNFKKERREKWYCRTMKYKSCFLTKVTQMGNTFWRRTTVHRTYTVHGTDTVRHMTIECIQYSKIYASIVFCSWWQKIRVARVAVFRHTRCAILYHKLQGLQLSNVQRILSDSNVDSAVEMLLVHDKHLISIHFPRVLPTVSDKTRPPLSCIAS